MSSDDISPNNDENGKEAEKVSLLFVDSLFQDVQTKIHDDVDPLNIKRSSIQNRGEQNQDNLPSSSSIKTPKKKLFENQMTNTKSSKNPHYTHSSADKNSYKDTKKFSNNSSQRNLFVNTRYNFSKNYTKKSGKSFKNTYVPINEKYKAKQESEKERKLYQEKVRLLENRILALKSQEDDMNKKIQSNKLRQNYLNKKKKEKNDFKQTLLSYDIDKRNELDEKRKAIKEQKNQLNKDLKESMERNKISKLRNYQKLQKEKKKALTLIDRNNHNFEKYGRNNVNKIKKEREKIKQNEIKKQRKHGKSMDNFYLESCEDNKQKTDKLKNKIKKLEQLELKYIKSINKTREGMARNNSVGVYYLKREMTPLKKLDLDEQIDNKYNNRTLMKNNNNNHDNKHRSDDIDYGIKENENENENSELIKVNKNL
jgi:hypothetical protein